MTGAGLAGLSRSERAGMAALIFAAQKLDAV